MSINELNNFDKLLKAKLESHQVEFVPSDWDKLEKQLPKQSPKPFYKNIWLWSGAVIVCGIIATVVLTNNKSSEEKTYAASSEMITKFQNHAMVSNHAKPIEIEVSESKNSTVTATESLLVSSENTNENIKGINKIAETIASNDEKAEVEFEKTVEVFENAPTNLSQNIPASNAFKDVEIKIPTIICDGETICEGSVCRFTTSGQDNVSYLWSFGDDTYSAEQNPVHLYSASGKYQVALIVRSEIDNSVVAKANDFVVQVNQLPTVTFKTEAVFVNGIPNISFTDLTEDAVNWVWSFGDGAVAETKTTLHKFRKKGYYDVNLKVINEAGCVGTNTQTIFIEKDYNLLAPNSFTPNGDGINDAFIPEALRIMNTDFSMQIFSQKEGLLYESKSSDMPWDGRNHQTGEKCAGGNYIWTVKLTNSKGSIEQYQGVVLLLK